ncbi:SIS domain-containing protein [Candidatus Izemoplasma sp. B36]|uniref:SIS domain-containing protein n=1 Tax=Candidatus Izemoplasma sp. B36 TaxID=3242468 RepID=UPI003556EE87
MITFMEKEIRSQSMVLKEPLMMNESLLNQIVKAYKDREINTIIYAARGSSDNAGVYFKYVIEINLGIPVSFSAPSIITIYSGKLSMKNTLVVGVSQSGEAEDVCIVLETAKKQGALTIGITNHMTSKLAKVSDFTLNLAVNKEISVAATKTYTAELVVLASLALKLCEQKNSTQRILDSIDLIQQITVNNGFISNTIDKFYKLKKVFVLGRGYVYGVAKELALKFQETSYIQAQAFATSDFYHGPLAMLDQNSLVILLVSDDHSYNDSIDLLERVKSITNNVIVITDKPNLECKDKIVIPKTEEMLSPFLFAVACQMIALQLSLKNGFNPDKPRNLKKVTITK